MKIPQFRFSWLEYYSKPNIFFKSFQYCFGTLFLHSRIIARFLFQNLSFKKNDLVLDIGSGDGNFSNWISYHSGCKVIGLDRLPHRVLLSKTTAQRYKLPNDFFYLDLEKNRLSFKKESFDKILMIDVLEHFKNPQKVIQLAGSWLKKEGYLFVSTPSENQHRIFLHSYQENFGYGKDQHCFEGFNIPTLIKWLRESGFNGEIKAEYIFYKFYQFGWELSEVVKKYNKFLYVILLPIFEILAFLDQIFPVGKKGNGIILLAQK